MKKYGDGQEERPALVLQIEARVIDNALHFRQAGATAELKDGTRVEIAALLNGATLCAMLLAPDGSTRTYLLTPEAVGAAILHAEGRVLTGQEAPAQDNP